MAILEYLCGMLNKGILRDIADGDRFMGPVFTLLLGVTLLYVTPASGELSRETESADHAQVLDEAPHYSTIQLLELRGKNQAPEVSGISLTGIVVDGAYARLGEHYLREMPFAEVPLHRRYLLLPQTTSTLL